MLKMKLMAILVGTALVASMAGCGGGEEKPGDVLIIVPDYGQSDVVADSVAVDDEGSVDRDVAGQDLAGDGHVVVDAVSDEGASDEGGTDTTVITDEGEDTIEDVGPQCWLGQDHCMPTSAEDKKTCQTAQIIGRVKALSDNGYFLLNPETINESTGGNGNDDQLDDDDCPLFGDGDDLWCKSVCDDDGRDHFYKVYLLPGDLFSLTINDKLILEHEDYGYHIDFMLKVYKGECPLDRQNLISCTNGADRSNVATYNNIQIKPLTAQEEGWYTIVVDSTGDDEAGTYTLEARLFQNGEYSGAWDLCCDFPSY